MRKAGGYSEISDPEEGKEIEIMPVRLRKHLKSKFTALESVRKD
jgi:hypothetical protein